MNKPKTKRSADRTTLTLGALARHIASLFPPHLAESWDNVGLQIGDPDAPVKRIMTCLEVTAPTILEARKRKADVIIAHHPLIFRPLKSVLESNPAARLVAELVRSGIGLIVTHTNMDCAPWGTNQVLAEACGLIPGEPLDPKPLNPNADSSHFKLVVFTPFGHEQAIIDAIHRGGGGRIGLYTHCTFRSEGTGTFKGGEGSDPFIGRAGEFEEAHEYRLESVVAHEARDSVLNEVIKAHPYEEPAYDFFPLNMDAGIAGAGCIARPPKPISLATLIQRVKRGLRIKQVRLSGLKGSAEKLRVRKVAICSGSGGSFIAKAAASGAEVYLTGETSYHYGIEAHQRGIVVMEVGHYESEQIVAGPLARKLAGLDWMKAAKVDCFASSSDLQPYIYK